MESGLEDRNNGLDRLAQEFSGHVVSMESGLEDRNNQTGSVAAPEWMGLSQWSPA